MQADLLGPVTQLLSGAVGGPAAGAPPGPPDTEAGARPGREKGPVSGSGWNAAEPRQQARVPTTQRAARGPFHCALPGCWRPSSPAARRRVG